MRGPRYTGPQTPPWPTYSRPLEPPPGSNGLGRWAAAQIGALTAHVEHLSARQDDLTDWSREQDSTLMRHAAELAALNARSQQPASKPEKALTLREKIDDWKAIGSAALWLVAAGLTAASALRALDQPFLARLQAAVAAFGGGH